MNDSKDIINLLTTDYIYFLYDKNMVILKKDGEYIYKDELLLHNDKKNIYSSVSGKILGLTKINNKKYVVIENDFKDKVKSKKGTKKFINRYTKDELIDLLEKFKIIDNFEPTSKVLIINGLDYYNEEITYNELMKNYTIQILDTIDALIEIMNIKKCFLAVNNMDSDLINILLNNIGTYPKIDLKLMSNNNIITKKEVLIDKLTNYKNKKYNIQYFNLYEIVKMYNLLKRNKPTSITYLTVDDGNEKEVVKVNIGSNLKDILTVLNIDNKKDIIINGLLNGYSIKDINFIIDEKIRSVFIRKENKCKEKKCINCGMCVSICPVNINPKYMYFNKDKKALEYKKKCINCGLCSYSCPAKINLNKGVIIDDKE